MNFIVIPIEDAQAIFTPAEIAAARKSNGGEQLLAHEETLLRKRAGMGLQTLPAGETGELEWPYPVYAYGSNELEALLQSAEWAQETEAEGRP